MNLHALSTKIPPTLRTFLLLWHNVLPIITLDCLISGEIERYTTKESVIGLCYHVVLFSSLDLSRSFTLSSIYLALSTHSLALLLALSLLSLRSLAQCLLALSLLSVWFMLSCRVRAMFGEESFDFWRGKLRFY